MQHCRCETYKPQSTSLGSGQGFSFPYAFDKGKLIVREMVELLVLELVDKGLVTDQMVLKVGYDIENLSDPVRKKAYKGLISTDFIGAPFLKQHTARQILTTIPPPPNRSFRQ